MQNFAVTAVAHFGYEASFFHIFQQAGRTVITNAQMTLY
jgi:hypothetical protein